MTANTANLKARNAIKRKSVRNAQNRIFSESLSSDCDLSNKSDYESSRLNKKKSYRKKDPIKLCAKLMEKFMTTVYKLKIIKLKLDKYLLQRRIYFLTFIESM